MLALMVTLTMTLAWRGSGVSSMIAVMMTAMMTLEKASLRLFTFISRKL